MPEKTSFPSIAVSESEKKKSSYYRQWCEAIVGNSFQNSWVVDYTKLAMLYNFYKVGTGSDLTGYLQTAPDGSAMPGIWMSSNNVHTRLQSLIGELEERGYQIKVRALNPEARDRKRDERERLRIERHLQEVMAFAEEESGLPLGTDEYIPQTDQELDEYMDLTWKDKHVQILESALKWIANRTHWDETRKALFTDRLIANISIIEHEIIRGVPQSKRVDPMRFIYDPHAKGDMLEDSTYFGKVDYMPLAAAAERYGLTLDEMKQAQAEYESYLGMGLEERAQSDTSHFNLGQSLKWFKTEDGTPRCLVIKACWRDIKVLAHKNETKEKYGTEYLQDVTYDDKEIKKGKDKIIKNKIECWRGGTLIGGKFMREWGECPNQPRELNSLEVTKPPFEVWRDTNSVAILEKLVTPQVLKDIALYQLQVQMARAVGKVLVFDEAMLPEGQSKDQVLARMKADGIAWVNSKEYQLTQGNLNLFKEFDLSLSQTIAQSMQIIDHLDRQIDSTSGITPERQGQVQGASQAVGVTQSAIHQSNLVTAPIFRGFDRMCARVLKYQAGLVKMVFGESDKFAPIIGDVGVDILKDSIDITVDEYDIEVQALPPIMQDRQKLEQIIMLAVQTGELPVSDALAILLENDLTVAVRKFTRRFAMRQMQLSQQEEQMNQMEQQMQQMQMQQQAQLQQGGWQNQLQLQGMKNQANLQKTALTGRVKLSDRKLSLLSGR